MSKTDHTTAYLTPAEAKATRELHTRQRKAKKMLALIKSNTPEDFNTWKAAEAVAVAAWSTRKAVCGGVE